MSYALDGDKLGYVVERGNVQPHAASVAMSSRQRNGFESVLGQP